MAALKGAATSSERDTALVAWRDEGALEAGRGEHGAASVFLEGFERARVMLGGEVSEIVDAVALLG